MTKTRIVSMAVAALICLSGCRAKSGDSTPSPSASSSGATSSGSRYDQGPRAGEEPVNAELAEAGEQLFKDKGCGGCHAFGARLSGPDLKGVTMRRTAEWMENQILHPEVMTKEDPISREMMGTYALQMPNLGLTPEQAKSLIEYLKEQEHEASEATASAGEEAEKKGD